MQIAFACRNWASVNRYYFIIIAHVLPPPGVLVRHYLGVLHYSELGTVSRARGAWRYKHECVKPTFGTLQLHLCSAPRILALSLPLLSDFLIIVSLLSYRFVVTHIVGSGVVTLCWYCFTYICVVALAVTWVHCMFSRWLRCMSGVISDVEPGWVQTI